MSVTTIDSPTDVEVVRVPKWDIFRRDFGDPQPLFDKRRELFVSNWWGGSEIFTAVKRGIDAKDRKQRLATLIMRWDGSMFPTVSVVGVAEEPLSVGTINIVDAALRQSVDEFAKSIDAGEILWGEQLPVLVEAEQEQASWTFLNNQA